MKLYRASGKPVLPQHHEAYLGALNKKMDELETELGKCNSGNAKEFQEKMETIHQELCDAYPNVAKVKYPRTAKDMKKLLEDYQCVAFCVEDGYLVAYVLDA